MADQLTENSSVNESDITASSGQPIIGTSIPTQEDDDVKDKSNIVILPQLPSHKFRYSNWHDLSRTDITGDQLHAPRVRYGPPKKDKMLRRLEQATGSYAHHHMPHGKERKNYQNEQENWEVAEICDLGYQELDHGYQHENFLRVLKRLHRVKSLNLSHNGLKYLNSVSLPECRYLVANENYIDSFKRIPRLAVVEVLSLDDNCIKTLSGLESLAKTPLRVLSLKRNPVEFTLNYRPSVFKKLPRLQVLDGLPKLPEDEEFVEDTHAQNESMCVLS